MFCVDSCVLPASCLTSSATTAKPRPCSPARAASIAAFNASKLVCSEIELITLVTSPILTALFFSSSIILAVSWTDLLMFWVNTIDLSNAVLPFFTLLIAFLVSSSACTALDDTSFEVLDSSLIAVEILSTRLSTSCVLSAVFCIS